MPKAKSMSGTKAPALPVKRAMPRRGGPQKVKRHQSLTVEYVKELGRALIAISDQHPLAYRTESDFFPLVAMYLRGRVPGTAPEHGVLKGRVDFRIGGTNPALLELAVAPRTVKDAHNPGQHFPGHGQNTQLYASQNQPELKKLGKVPQSQARNRFLLLVDFGPGLDLPSLEESYRKLLPSNGKHAAVRVVYAHRDPQRERDFSVGGKPLGRPTSP